MMKDITKQQIIDRIRFENPWWNSGKIDNDFGDLPNRLYFDLFKNLIFQKELVRAVVLMGPRRVGKTVMLYHTVQELIDSGVDPLKILFITIENPIYNGLGLEQLYRYAKEATGMPEGEDWYMIFDEVQYCKDWEVYLKVLVDSYRKDKFIVSGSAAAVLNYASAESGAGRFSDFLLPPLTFAEYISMKGMERLLQPINGNSYKDNWSYKTDNLPELNRHFLDYINYGGYPEVLKSEGVKSELGRYIKRDILDKVLLRDLPGLYGIADTKELNSLFTALAYNTGAEISLDSLSKQSNVPKNTLKKYLEYLEAAYLIIRVRRIDQSGNKFRRDNFFKIYLTNPSLRSALYSPISATDEMIGSVVETAVISQWLHRESFTPWYARWQSGEVDIVGLSRLFKPEWALEIKWSDRFYDNPKELKGLIKFCKEHNINSPIVTTINKQGIVDHDGISINFIPASVYSFTIGKQTLEGN